MRYTFASTFFAALIAAFISEPGASPTFSPNLL